MLTINTNSKPIYILFDYELPENNLERDSFIFLLCSWNNSSNMVNLAKSYSEYNIILLANSLEEKSFFESKVKNEVLFCNHNAFLNEHIFKIDNFSKKEYDLVIDSAFNTYKNVNLAKNVPNVIHIGYFKNRESTINDNIVPDFGVIANYLNGPYKRLKKEEISGFYNKSLMGGIFSHTEGACFASSQYLLCGLPVISTKSVGGRDIWYNKDNSIICESDEASVLEAYETVKKKLFNREFNREKIRNMHLQQMDEHRNTLVEYIKHKFLLLNEKVDTEEIKSHFCNLKIS
jgi:glycosyltransferase involved in cell wall biosynthesis